MTHFPAGSFGSLGRISGAGFVSIQDCKHGEPDQKKIAEASFILDIEYRSVGCDIDAVFIAEKIKKAVNQRRLNNFSLFVPLVKNIIDQENPNYNQPPVRMFRNGKGDLITSKKVLDRLSEIYDQLDMDNNMLTISHQAAYMGTVLAMPQLDPETNWMNILKITPDVPTLSVGVNDFNRSRADVVSYEVEDVEKKEKKKFEWNLTDRVITTTINAKETIDTDPHGFVDSGGKTGQPFVVLRYTTDTNRFFGPYDGGLLSLIKTRSLLIADSIHRTQTSLFEILQMAGFSTDEAISALETIDKGVIAYQYDEKTDASTDPKSKDISYVSPEGMSPEMILDVWLKLYNHFLKARGHTQKNFDTSNLVVSAESMRLANKGLLEMRDRRRKNVTKFEQEFFKRIIWENNSSTENVKIPRDITLDVDWQPDDEGFDNSRDKVVFYESGIKNNYLTGPEIIRRENPELSQQASEEKFQSNKEFNEANVTVVDVAEPNESDASNKKPDDKTQDGKI